MKKKYSQRNKRIKILSISTLIVLGLLILFVSLQAYQNISEANAKPLECTKNSDCIIIRGGFCSCEDGGSPQCIPKNQLDFHVSKIESCSRGENYFGKDCGQISCGCVNNVCVGKPA